MNGVAGGYAAMGLMSLGAAYAQGESQKAQADFAASQYRINQKITTEDAELAKAKGDIQAGEQAEKGRQEEAEQRVHQAATGANVNAGSALDIQSDTAWQSTQNQITVKNNAWRQAWGYGVEAMSDQYSAEMEDVAGSSAMTSSLLTGGMQAIGYGVQAGAAEQRYG